MGFRERVGIFGGPVANNVFQRMFLEDSNHLVLTDGAVDPKKIAEAMETAVKEGMTVAVINHMRDGQDGKIDEVATLEALKAEAPDVTTVIFSYSSPTEAPKGDILFKREGSPDDFPLLARVITRIPREYRVTRPPYS
jgi:hypothetical protein